ncbi:MAG: hypothetical protein ACI3ZD_02085 [Prevotella sp.]
MCIRSLTSSLLICAATGSVGVSPAASIDTSTVLRSEGLLQLRRGKILIPELRNLS